MTLTNQQNAVNITLPSAGNGASAQKIPDPLVVSLNSQGQLYLGNQPITENQLVQPMQAYLQKNPNGVVILNADRKLPYEKVIQLLGSLRDIGGDRVSLAIDN
jgi:biopolymer transport protein ExbD